jgi:Helix-turn-helix domain of resolvase
LHPEVEFVSRDPGGTYVDGATWGAPQATQIADRWHLLANLGDAVEEFLIRARIRLVETPALEPTVERPLTNDSATPGCQGKSQARLLQKWKLYQQVKALHDQGMGTQKIAIELGLARNTVRKYLRQAPEPPLPTPRPLRESGLDRYEDYILVPPGRRASATLLSFFARSVLWDTREPTPRYGLMYAIYVPRRKMAQFLRLVVNAQKRLPRVRSVGS